MPDIALPDFGFHVPVADVSHVRRKWLDLPYAGASPAERLDLYLPDEGSGPFPVVLFIHGGGFALGHKRDLHIPGLLAVRERGYALVSVEYRLSGEAVFPAGVRDVKAAVRWLRAHGARYELDGARVAAWGTSSGGNFAALLATSEGEPLFDDPALGSPGRPAQVLAAVDWFGPTDFLAMDEQLEVSGFGPGGHSRADSAESRYLGAPITEVPGQVRLANPATYVDERTAPIFIQHGTGDRIVPYQQSVELARVIEERCGPDRVRIDLLEGAGHEDGAFHTPQNTARILDFIDRNLR